MIVAIHQPNFIPWLPFFDKMAAADVFVILSECQFEKNGFQNRFQRNGWNTMSVASGLVPIREKQYVAPQKDWQRIKARNANSTVLAEMDALIGPSLLETNVAIIRHLAAKLKIKTRIELDFPTSKTSTDRLVEICQEFHATEYLAGASGGNYMDATLFDRAGIKIVTQSLDISRKIPIIDHLCSTE